MYLTKSNSHIKKTHNSFSECLKKNTWRLDNISPSSASKELSQTAAAMHRHKRANVHESKLTTCLHV